jgi:hypothetical protein
MTWNLDRLEIAFLVQLALAIAALVGGSSRTRMNWRPDIEPYGRATRAVDVLLHPERYAVEQSLRGVRILNLCGLVLLVGTMCVLAWRAVRDILAAWS